MMRERAVRFGPGGCLTGIVSEVPGETAPAGRPAFLMVNAGLLHHVGPARIHVALGRALAAHGTTCLRFDLAGMGDSDGRRDAAVAQGGVAQDVRDAMDFLSSTRGVATFIVFGICAGAHVAFESAKADRRIVGLVSIDGYAYRTPRYYWEYYRPRMLRWRPWMNFAREQGRRLTTALRRGQGRDARYGGASTFRVAFPPKREVAGALRALTSRGVRQFYIFTGAHGRHYNYARQFRDAFPSVGASGAVRVAHWPTTGHMFEGLEAQATLFKDVADWVDNLPSTGHAAVEPRPGGSREPVLVSKEEYVV